MRRSAPLIACIVLGLLASFGPIRDARAEDEETVNLDRQTGLTSRYRVHAKLLGTPAGDRNGGYGYVRVKLINPTAKAHDVVIHLQPGMYGFQDEGCSFRKSQRLAPNSRITMDLPLLNARSGMAARFTLDGRDVDERVQLRSNSRGYGFTFAALRVGSPQDGSDWAAYLKKETKRIASRRRSDVDLRTRTPEQLPNRWLLLSGFDLIIVDHAASGLTPERQQTLVRYVAGGGNLIVTGMASTSTGPLADMRGPLERDVVDGRHGLGRWIAMRVAGDAHSLALQAWLQESPQGVGSIIGRVGATHAGGAPPALWLPLQIPGLGEVPTGVFFLLILLFVLVVGPVSYVYFRRKRRLAMLLVTIPVTGFVCTALILAYGLFSEGFGIIGSARSFTVLDQETHFASSAVGRTLYAGLEPGALVPSADSFVASASFMPDSDGRGSRSVLRVDLDKGYRIGGGLLPSRTPTPFVTTTVGRSRERLRFRRRPDGGFDVLAAPGFAPVQEPGAVLLHTKEGGYYMSVAGGHLAPVSGQSKDNLERASTLVSSVVDMPLGSGEVVSSAYWGRQTYYRSRVEMEVLAEQTRPLSGWIAARVGTLQPGSYLARVTQPPVREELGLDVEYRREEHVVLGLLGPEDVIDE